MDDPGLVAGYYADLLNTLQESGGEVTDDLLKACHDELQDSDWVLEWAEGSWKAREADA